MFASSINIIIKYAVIIQITVELCCAWGGGGIVSGLSVRFYDTHVSGLSICHTLHIS